MIANNGVGVIIPPPGVREFVETTASFVGKKPAVEAKILSRHENDSNFSFLKPDDPYHAYYRKRVTEVRDQLAGKTAEKRDTAGDEKQQQPPQEAQKPAQSADAEPREGTTSKGAVVSILKTARAKRAASRGEPTEPPPDDVFTVLKVTPSPSPLALDVIKLSAEYVASHGPEFLDMLSRKESRNTLFDFLKPLHPHFIVFQKLVDAYNMLISEDGRRKLLEDVGKLAESKDAVMDSVWYMHDWECISAEREAEAVMDESEKLKAAQIDWHDFVVLETVQFNDNDPLPAPISDAKQIPRMLAARRKAEAERIKNASNVDMEIDEPAKDTKDPRMVVDPVSDIPKNLIRPSTTTAKKQEQPSETTIVLPSGQRVPLSKAEESVKAELLNPAYKDERARAAEKNRLQNLAGGEEMARNLARLDARRSEGGVYNRADLQEALKGRAVVGDEEVERRLGKAVASGPNLPEDLDPRPVKKARVEKAVEELTKKRVEEEVVLEEEPRADEGGVVNGLIGEVEWLKRTGGSAQARIKLPVHANSEWMLQGQEIEMKVPLKRSVAKLKGVIAKLVKIPANKQKLWVEGPGFMKDKMSLASYNIGDGCVIRLEVKERGGRKRGGG